MNIRLHLEIAGALLMLLGLGHAFMGRYFGWNRELAGVSLFTRQVFEVHTFFIGLLLVLLGACSFFYAGALVEPSPLSRAVLTGMLLFWLCRLGFQWFVYDPGIWRGNRFRTVMHVVFSVFWIYVVLTYGGALYSHLSATSGSTLAARLATHRQSIADPGLGTRAQAAPKGTGDRVPRPLDRTVHPQPRRPTALSN